MGRPDEFRHWHDGNWLSGGADRDRTGDLKLAKLALSQLSYGPLGPLVQGLRSEGAAIDAAVQPLIPDPGGPGKS
jgi:hypothetical protein